MSGLTKAVSRGAQERDHSILQPFSQTHLRSFVSGMGCWCSSCVGYRVPGHLHVIHPSLDLARGEAAAGWG